MAWFLPLALVNILLTAGAKALGQEWLTYLLPGVLLGVALLLAFIRYQRDDEAEVPKLARSAQLAGVGGTSGTSTGEDN